MGRLHKRSFGIVMLVVAVVAIAPGASIVAGLLLMIPAVQMIAGRSAPVFPRRIADHPFPTRRLAVLVRRAVPVLRYIETVVHPRWPTPVDATKRIVGAVVMMLNTTLLMPIPLSNVMPALTIALISLAYLEEDGLLLSVGLLAALIVLAGVCAAIWQTVLGAIWIGSLQ
jgi:hypothetical protein